MPTHVQKAISADGTATAANTVAVSFGSVATSGNLVCGSVTFDSNSATLSTVKDNLNNSYTISDNVQDTANTQSHATFYLVVGNSPITITATFSATTSFRRIQIDEYSGIGASPIDGHTMQVQTAPGTGTNAVTSGNITPTIGGDLLYGVTVASSGSSTITAGTTPAYAIENNGGGAVNLPMASEDAIYVSGNVAATFTAGTSRSWVTGVAAFKAAAAGVSWIFEQDISRSRPLLFPTRDFQRAQQTDWTPSSNNAVTPAQLGWYQPEQFPRKWSRVLYPRSQDRDWLSTSNNAVTPAQLGFEIEPKQRASSAWIFRNCFRDPDLVFHPYVAPFVEELERFQRRFSWHHPTVDPDLTFRGTNAVTPAQTGWDVQPQGPRRLAIRARSNDPDLTFQGTNAVTPAQLGFIEAEPPPRRFLERSRSRQGDPDPIIIVSPAAAPPFIYEEDRRAGRFLLWRRIGDTDLIVVPILPAFTEDPIQRAQKWLFQRHGSDLDWISSSGNSVTPAQTGWDIQPQGPRRLVIRSRSNDPDLTFQGTNAATPTQTGWDVQPQGPRRLVIRSRWNDPDLTFKGTNSATPTQLGFINPELRPRQFPQRAYRQGDPDTPQAPLAAPFIHDDGQRPRRLLLRGRVTDVELIVIPIRPSFVEDTPQRSRELLLSRRTANLDPIVIPAVVPPTIFIENIGSTPRRLLWRPHADTDFISTIIRSGGIVFVDDPAQFSRHLIAHIGRSGDELIVTPSPPTFVETDYTGARRFAFGRPPIDQDAAFPGTGAVTPIHIAWDIEEPRPYRSIYRAPPLDTDPPFNITPPPLYQTAELTAPQFILDFSNVLRPDISLVKIESIVPTLPSFREVAFIHAGICVSPTSGLLQAIAGEIQVSQAPAVIRFVLIGSDGTRLTVDGVHMGKLKFFY